jgi:Raf kinase inhibitor-like YbhB/YbcL family protein
MVEDPDAPYPANPLCIWVLWLVTDLPTDTTGLPEGVRTLPEGVVGLNDWERAGWGGPAPPIGRHRYIFKLYALDREIGIDEPTKYDLDRVLGQAIVLAEAKLVGTYARKAA